VAVQRLDDGSGDAEPVHGAPIDCVVTHHLDGFRSGVARFNELLAERLGVPLASLADRVVGTAACPLLSFKFSELGPDAEAALARELGSRPGAFELAPSSSSCTSSRGPSWNGGL
jgi:hypothetical protein